MISRTSSRVSWFLLLLLAGAPRLAHAQVALGCQKDIECKGDRICVSGQCVDPHAAPPAPVAPPPVVTPALEPPPPLPVSTVPPAAPPPPPAVMPSPVPPPSPNVVLTPMGELPPGPPPMRVVLYTPPAEEAVAERGLTFGLRAGVGFPGGAAVAPVPESATGGSSSGDLGDVVGVLVPITFELGYRLSSHWLVGAYLGVGYGTGANCAEGGSNNASCYETDIRFGLDAQYRFFPRGVFQPWVGLGAGWEVLNQISTDDDGDEESGSLNGVEFAHIDIGGDFRLGSPTYAPSKLGPYFQMAFGEYDNGYVHEWYTVGLRFHYDTNLLARR